jgi:hypothetical protein
MLKVSKATGNSHGQHGIENMFVQSNIRGLEAGGVVK